MKKILAIIPARGGSKGIPKKNIKLLGDIPLIVYTIETAKKCKYFSDVIVSTDSNEIAKISSDSDMKVPFIRPAELATDKTTMLPVIQHAVEFMEKENNVIYDFIVTLQPTSPFRKVEDINKGIELLVECGADSVVSVVEVGNHVHPLKLKKIVNDSILPYFADEPEGILRQNFEPIYRRSGDFYGNRRDLVMNENKFYGSNVKGFIVDSRYSIDIDDEFDWFKAEYLLKNRL